MPFDFVRLVSIPIHFQKRIWFPATGLWMVLNLGLAFSAFGLESEASPPAAIEFVSFLDTGKLVFAPKEKILMFVETSPQENLIFYRWRSSIGNDPVPIEGNPSKAYWEAPALEGVYKITVTAFDKNRDIQRSHFFNIRISLDEKSVFKPEPSIAQK
jgi:hypothetical protein